MYIFPNPCKNCEALIEGTSDIKYIKVTDAIGRIISFEYEKTPMGYKIFIDNEFTGIGIISNLDSHQHLKFIKF